MEREGWRVTNGAEGVECMSGLVDPALDIFVCSSIFVDDAAQVDKLLHLVQVFVVECDGVLLLVVYSHHLRLLCVDIVACLHSFFGEAGELHPVGPGVCVRGG